MREAAWAAGEHDIEHVLALAALLRAELAAERGGVVWLAADAAPAGDGDVRRWLRDATMQVFVGGIDETVLGYCVVRAAPLRDGSRLGVIEELFVEPEARAVGVGEELLTAAMAWCVQHECRGIDATALPGQRATKNFFEGSGFVARRLTMHHSLEAETEERPGRFES